MPLFRHSFSLNVRFSVPYTSHHFLFLIQTVPAKTAHPIPIKKITRYGRKGAMPQKPPFCSLHTTIAYLARLTRSKISTPAHQIADVPATKRTLTAVLKILFRIRTEIKSVTCAAVHKRRNRNAPITSRYCHMHKCQSEL